MLRLLAHRGDQPVEATQLGHIAIGCSRLAIVDRLANRQPFLSPAKDVAVVLNGEIYNYLDLREELLNAGYRFSTNGDCEVLLNGFLHWGERLFERLDGMFAIGIADHRQGASTLFLARDHFGIKPLYLGDLGQAQIFSSEIFPLVKQGASSVRAIQPGHYSVDGVIKRFVDGLPEPETEGDIDTWASKLRVVLSTAVKKRIQTDLPIAVLCSGGIDSAILLYEVLCNATDRSKIHVFTVGTAVSTDVAFAKVTVSFLAKRFGNDLKGRYHHVEISQEDMIDSIPETVQAIESFEPNHIRAGTANLWLAKSMSRLGFKIALCGEGADEAFGGYHEFVETFDKHGPAATVKILKEFFLDLHRTQLQRVDRTNMRYGIEARVPFMDKEFVRMAFSIPVELKFFRQQSDIISKFILRYSYKDILPEKIVWRRKVPLGEGAGIGDNGDHGPFYMNSKNFEVQQGMQLIGWDVRTHEERLYASYLYDHLGQCPDFGSRPRTNFLGTK
jgi:asparagine synthase (glutamine-hydrolysing)